MEQWNQKDYITGLSSALVIVTAMIVEDLEKHGALSKAELAERLRATADAAEAQDRAERGERPRYDLYLIRRVLQLLETPAPVWEPEPGGGGPGKAH